MFLRGRLRMDFWDLTRKVNVSYTEIPSAAKNSNRRLIIYNQVLYLQTNSLRLLQMILAFCTSSSPEGVMLLEA